MPKCRAERSRLCWVRGCLVQVVELPWPGGERWPWIPIERVEEVAMQQHKDPPRTPSPAFVWGLNGASKLKQVEGLIRQQGQAGDKRRIGVVWEDQSTDRELLCRSFPWLCCFGFAFSRSAVKPLTVALRENGTNKPSLALAPVLITHYSSVTGVGGDRPRWIEIAKGDTMPDILVILSKPPEMVMTEGKLEMQAPGNGSGSWQRTWTGARSTDRGALRWWNWSFCSPSFASPRWRILRHCSPGGSSPGQLDSAWGENMGSRALLTGQT